MVAYGDYTFAGEAERCLSRLADLTADLDPRDPAAVLGAGLAAIANALLSIDQSGKSAVIDVTNAVSDLSDRVADVEDAIGAASDRAARPRWWRPASQDDRQAYAVARAALSALPADAGEDELAAANDAVIITGARLPWWQR